MGAFDDLIPQATPQASGGLFDDLIPANPTAEPAQGAPRMVEPASLVAPVAPDMPAAPPQPSPADVLLGMAPVPAPRPDLGAVLAPDAPAVDESSAGGDLEAGLLTLQQAGEGLRAATAGIELVRPDISSEREQALRADLGEVQAQLEQAKTMAASAPGNEALAGLVARRQAAVDEITSLLATPTPVQEAAARDSAGRLAESALATQRLGDEIAGIPQNPAAERVGQAESFGEGVEAMLDDPLGVVRTFVLRSLPASAPGIGGAVAGSLAGPAGAAAGAGAGEGGVEFGISAAQGLLEAMKAAGVEAGDPAAVEAFVTENPDVFNSVLQDAAVRAGIIGGAGALGGAASAKVAQKVAGKGLPALMGGTAAGGLAIEPAAEGAGEAGAQLATEGRVSPGEVLAEMIGGGGQGAVQTAGQIAVSPLGTDHLSPEQQRAKALADFLAESEPEATPGALRGGGVERIAVPQDRPRAPELPKEPAQPLPVAAAPEEEPAGGPLPQERPEGPDAIARAISSKAPSGQGRPVPGDLSEDQVREHTQRYSSDPDYVQSEIEALRKEAHRADMNLRGQEYMDRMDSLYRRAALVRHLQTDRYDDFYRKAKRGKLTFDKDVKGWERDLVQTVYDEFGIDRQLRVVRGGTDGGAAIDIKPNPNPFGRSDFVLEIALPKSGRATPQMAEKILHELGHLIDFKVRAENPGAREKLLTAWMQSFDARRRPIQKWMGDKGLFGSAREAKRRRGSDAAWEGEAWAKGRIREDFGKMLDTLLDNSLVADPISDYGISFAEWFANQTARHLETDVALESFVDRYFAKVAAIWRKLIRKLRAQGFANLTVAEVVDSLRKTPQAPAEPDQAAPAPASPAEEPTATKIPAPDPETRPVEQVYTPDNEAVDVQFAVVEADDLLTSDQEGYPAELQPRDRSRAESELQIESIANAPNPRRLFQSSETDRGAPVIGPDGIVESGNGRVMALRRAYERGTSEEYRRFIEENFPEAAGMRTPVLVRRRVEGKGEIDRRAFAKASNVSATLAMSETEQAQSDADLIDLSILTRMGAQAINAPGNRDAVREFFNRLPASERAALINKEGGLTIEGQRRFQNALFAKAYGNPRLLERVTEGTDDDSRALTNAFLERAPEFARLRERIRQGQVGDDVDPSQAIQEAVEAFSKIRAEGGTLADYRAQGETFFGEGISADGDLFLEALFGKDGRRPASKKAISEFLRTYAELAESQRIDQDDFGGDLSSGDRMKAGDIARRALEQTRSTPDEQGALLDPLTPDRRGRRADGKEPPRLADAGSQRARQPRRSPDGEGEPRGEGGDQAGREGRLRDRGEVAPDDDAAGVSTKPGTTGKTLPRSGTLSPTFLEFSFSDRNSVFADAAKAAGYTAEQFRLLHADKQIAELSRVLRRDYGVRVEMPTRTITRKTITGRKVQEERTRINTRDTIDQLLDAYRQFKMLTHVLGLPMQAVALKENGSTGEPVSLSLVDLSTAGALGSYSYGENRRIALPDRSNSFAHEWGHALDHWLLLQLRKDQNPRQLLSDVAAERGVGDVKIDRGSRVRGAFAQVMLSLFGDRAKLALLQIELQAQASEIGENGQRTKAAIEAAATLEGLRQGRKPPGRLMNRYFESSKEFDDAVGSGGYFVNPAEMFARAFEAYISVRVAQVSDLPQSFLTKGDWAYTQSEERRARDTFPKGETFERILADFDELFHQIRNATLFGSNERAPAPEDNTAFDNSQWDRYKPPEGSMLQREREAWSQLKSTAAAVEQEGARARRLGDAFHSWGSTFGGYAHRIARRQKSAEARRALMNIVDHVATEPGSNRTVGVVWEEAVERRAKSQMNRLQNIMARFKIDKWTDEQRAELRKLLTVPGTKASSPEMEQAASALRGLMDEAWRYTKSAGIDVGYVKNGWLPRIPNMDKVFEDMQGFLRQARKLYSVVYDRDVREGDFEEQVNDLNRLIRRFRSNTRPTAEGETAAVSLLTDEDEALIESWRKARKEANRLARLAEKEQDGDKRAALEEKAAKADEAMQEIHGEVLDRIGEIFAEEAAFNWYLRIQIGSATDYDTKGPDATFLKKRTLPAEADELMADYFVGDAIHLIGQYLLQAPRRVEYARRFGAQSEKLEAMLEAAGRAGADGRDVREIRALVNILTGRMKDTQDASWAWVGGWVYVAATVSLLKRATWSSLAEPSVAGMRTGNVADSITGFARLLGQFARTAGAKERAEVARAIGLVTASQFETVMHNRYGGDFNPSARQQRILTSFFTFTGLTGLTNLQRTAMLGTASHAISRNLRYVREGTPRQKEMAKAELRELGIPDAQMEELAEWMGQFPKGFPGLEDLQAPDGGMNRAAELWAGAAIRLTEQIIQNPKRFDRPKLAALPGTRMLYGIMGFTFAFHRNILLPIFRRHIEPRRADESAAAFAARQTLGVGMNLARVAPSAAALFGAHFLVTVAREALFNPDKWEEKDDDDVLLQWLLERAFSRTGLTGAFDPLVQLAFGIKYQRDLASGFAGAHAGFFLDELDDLLALGFRNSPNTNTAERNATKTATSLITGTAMPMLLSLAPGGPITQPMLGAAIMASDHPAPGEMMADLLVGPPDR